jgi:hypothetical protein
MQSPKSKLVNFNKIVIGDFILAKIIFSLEVGGQMSEVFR